MDMVVPLLVTNRNHMDFDVTIAVTAEYVIKHAMSTDQRFTIATGKVAQVRRAPPPPPPPAPQWRLQRSVWRLQHP